MNNKINKHSKEYKLAYEIAEGLNDMESLEVHIAFAESYNESVLRKYFNRVMAIPEDKIKRTRGALYTYLVKQHGRFGNRG
jgi:hypothetical protein